MLTGGLPWLETTRSRMAARTTMQTRNILAEEDRRDGSGIKHLINSLGADLVLGIARERLLDSDTRRRARDAGPRPQASDHWCTWTIARPSAF